MSYGCRFEIGTLYSFQLCNLPLRYIIFLYVIKYTTLDELHENDPGLKIDVIPDSARDDLVSIKLHNWHPFALHIKFPSNVVVVLLTLMWIKMCV